MSYTIVSGSIRAIKVAVATATASVRVRITKHRVSRAVAIGISRSDYLYALSLGVPDAEIRRLHKWGFNVRSWAEMTAPVRDGRAS
ncbi:hypothetical protein [Nonomuraea sp. NPDC049784]|uniref:hypothetical protein n=1 Tax=Nonomuraea sp. NPDC049784 TaxID=3154361 RepID=UPI0033DD9742